ncbi:response regulator transcription factor [Streptomyces sp. NBC_01007]|nr:response regulator transcription factor [Streptomyces sp. NBC_01007]
MRIVIADDELLLCEGLARLLIETGHDVVGTVGDASALLRAVERESPDVVVTDIRMPPTHTDEGLVAAAAIGEKYPAVGVLVLSHYLDSRYALQLLERHPERAGYLLKERVSDVAVLLDALRRIAEGECVIDPTIVSRLMAKKRAAGPLDRLSAREREVLTLMAQGHSNGGIAVRLCLSQRTVEAHVAHIFTKLGVPESADYHRRVLAVLFLLRGL